MGTLNPPYEVLATKPRFGSVTTGSNDFVHVAVGDVVLRLASTDFWMLMEMLSEAARQLVGVRPQMSLGPTPLHTEDAK